MPGAPYFPCTLTSSNDASALNGALRLHNAARITHCFEFDFLNGVLMSANAIYQAREELIRTQQVPPDRQLAFQRRTILLDELNMQIALPSLIIESAREYLGKEPVQGISSVRAIRPGPDDQRLPFHQDQAILNQPLLNIWIPLTPCGLTAPGLEVAVTEQRALLQIAGSKDDPVPVERFRIDEDLVLTTYGSHALWRPVMEPGEVLVFTGTTAHRTFVAPEMKETRVSIELRLL
jgi:hypothetical protein